MFLLTGYAFGLFHVHTITIAGNGDGQFDGESIRILNGEIDPSLRLDLALDYQSVAAQASDTAQYVNVNGVLGELTDRMRAGETFDVIELDVIWIPYFAEMGWIVPVDGVSGQRVSAHQYGPAYSAAKHDVSGSGYRLYAKPNFLNVGLMIYRTDLLRELELDVPKTLKEFKRALEEAKKRGYTGYAFQGKAYGGLLVNYFEMLWAHGGEISLNEEGVPIVDSEEGADALEFMQTLIKDELVPRDALSHDEVGSLKHFTSNKTLVLRNWPRAYFGLRNLSRYEQLADKVAVFPQPLPARAGMPKQAAKMCSGGWFYAVSASAMEEGKYDAALKSIDFLTSEEQYRRSLVPAQYSRDKGEYGFRVPANQNIINRELTERGALHYVQDYFAKEWVGHRPKLAKYNEFSKIMIEFIYNALMDTDRDPAIQLKKAQREINAMY